MSKNAYTMDEKYTKYIGHVWHEQRQAGMDCRIIAELATIHATVLRAILLNKAYSACQCSRSPGRGLMEIGHPLLKADLLVKICFFL